ncbi:uncharacterized protein LOC141851007 [Brevipalpus obovatus]|uniref:uncharacterized protein LOC141851007 n=1 Tax=Brevipalpus obovatus TaxID=246614 RepID=UPI003D9ED719
MNMYAFIVITVVFHHFANGLPVAMVEDFDNNEAMKTIPTGKSNKLDSSIEKSVERGDFGGADSPGVVLKASVDQKEGSQQTFVHSLSQDNSTVTATDGVLRQQSNSNIYMSDVSDLNLSILPDVSLGGRF